MTTQQSTAAQPRRHIRANAGASRERARWCGKELAHIRCDHTTGARLGESLHRGRKETEAESVAHLCCRALGLDTQVYSDAYVLGWADGDMDLVKDCAETVLRVAKAILKDLNPAEAADAEDTVNAPTSGRSGIRKGAGRGRRKTAAGKRRTASVARGQQ